jgi:hypothetical protein
MQEQNDLPIAWDPKDMLDLITIRYEHIYVDVIIFVSNYFLKN